MIAAQPPEWFPNMKLHGTTTQKAATSADSIVGWLSFDEIHMIWWQSV
jgi:hypothetical protein